MVSRAATTNRMATMMIVASMAIKTSITTISTTTREDTARMAMGEFHPYTRKWPQANG